MRLPFNSIRTPTGTATSLTPRPSCVPPRRMAPRSSCCRSASTCVARPTTTSGTKITGASRAGRAGSRATLGIDLIAGSTSERRDGHDKLFNTSLHFGPDGQLKGRYRKIHLFDVTVGATEYRESDSDEPGDELVVSEAGDGTKVGLSVCYDVRFPELYRILALNGALVLTVPANFTRATGEAHWELLLRARAVENQAFVVAPAQAGEYPPGMPAYGNSMIVDPWGEILARADGSGTGFIAAELDFDRLAEVRAKLPSLKNRVPGAYRWPLEVHA